MSEVLLNFFESLTYYLASDVSWIADLKTMSKRVESEQYYMTLEMFVADAKRMFANARTYNSPETIYYKCSSRFVIANFVQISESLKFK